MPDTYINFAALAAVETLGTDYRIRSRERDALWLIMAIHGGGIETGTSELCRAVAGEEESGPWWSEYRFEGIKGSGNSVLHITATNFDEPHGLAIVDRHVGAVSLHGTSGNDPITYLGGLDTFMRNRIGAKLTEAGFITELATGGLAGTDPDNIANKGILSMGVQLEITTAQRSAWFGTNTAADRWATRNTTFQAYVTALRLAINGAVDLG